MRRAAMNERVGLLDQMTLLAGGCRGSAEGGLVFGAATGGERVRFLLTLPLLCVGMDGGCSVLGGSESPDDSTLVSGINRALWCVVDGPWEIEGGALAFVNGCEISSGGVLEMTSSRLDSMRFLLFRS